MANKKRHSARGGSPSALSSLESGAENLVNKARTAIGSWASGVGNEISRDWYGSDGVSGPGGRIRTMTRALSGLRDQENQIP